MPDYDENDPGTWSDEQLLAAESAMNEAGSPAPVVDPPEGDQQNQQQASPGAAPPAGTPPETPSEAEGQQAQQVTPDWVPDEYRAAWQEDPVKAAKLINDGRLNAIGMSSKFGKYNALLNLLDGDPTGATYAQIEQAILNGGQAPPAGGPVQQPGAVQPSPIDQITNQIGQLKAANYDPVFINVLENMRNTMASNQNLVDERIGEYSTQQNELQRTNLNNQSVQQFFNDESVVMSEDKLLNFVVQARGIVQPTGPAGSFTKDDLMNAHRILNHEEILNQKMAEKITGIRNALMNGQQNSDNTLSANPSASNNNPVNHARSTKKVEDLLGASLDETQQNINQLGTDELWELAKAQGLVGAGKAGGLNWE
jgi:hypothetical protein